MFRWLFLTACFVLTAAELRMVCYYTNWAQYRPGRAKYLPEDLDPNLCTHGIYSFAKLSGNNLAAYEWNDDDTDWSKGMYSRFNALKVKNPNFKTLIAVGGWNMGSEPFTAMVATDAGRKQFCESTVLFLRNRNFDGLDLDWEYPANRGSPAGDKERFAQLCETCRNVFEAESSRTGKPRLLLSAAVAAGQGTIDPAYDVPSISKSLDFINLMTYDLHGQWESTTGHNAPLYPGSWESGDSRKLNVDFAAKYWIQKGCPPQKLNLGLGTYGRSFKLVNPSQNGLNAPAKGGAPAGPYTREDGFFSYFEVCDLINSGAVYKFDAEQQIPYISKNDIWVGYDNEESLQIKVQRVIKANNLGGGMIWALDLDDFNGQSCGKGPYPLLRAINAALKGDSVPSQTQRPSSQPSIQPQTQRPSSQPSIQPQTQRPSSQPSIQPQTQRPSSQPSIQPQTQRPSSQPSIQPKTQRPSSQPSIQPQTQRPPSTENFCNAKSDGLYSHPGDCGKYIQCHSDVTYLMSCPSGLLFNSNGSYCDWPQNVNCVTV